MKYGLDKLPATCLRVITLWTRADMSLVVREPAGVVLFEPGRVAYALLQVETEDGTDPVEGLFG